MHGSQSIGLFASTVSMVLSWMSLMDSRWGYDVSSLTSFGLWAFSGTGVSIKLANAGLDKLGYDVVTPTVRPATYQTYCSIPSVVDHDPWCGSAANAARFFHVVGFIAGMIAFVVSTFAMLSWRFPNWNGTGRRASLPWAIFLSFCQGVAYSLGLLAWPLAQQAMEATCHVDKLVANGATCINTARAFYIFISNTILSLVLFWWWRHVHQILVLVAFGARHDATTVAGESEWSVHGRLYPGRQDRHVVVVPLLDSNHGGVVDDLDEVLGLIAAKIDVNALGSDGRNALHWACALNRSTVVHVLLKKGAKISQKDKDGWTPLHWASRMGNTDVVRLLVKAGADVNAKDTWGTTPLMLTVLGKSRRAAQCLLELGANINARNVYGQTALMQCVEEDAGMHSFAVMLINADASLKLRDYQGMNVLHYAASAGLDNICRVLMECSEPDVITQVNKFGDSPATEAHLRNRTTTAQLFQLKAEGKELSPREFIPDANRRDLDTPTASMDDDDSDDGSET
ncbi:hypothetical protein Ae201684_001991 [Aphanomyces euteiches]|uniref:Uncharacterized protein n=1 Tax=Aphanomyces euteiches TaxID=100861 RepID=A0A6G0XS58_9STRA|nr:hypothetical protein Ae201684_001991 [Aphanomyces euteiches]